MLNLLKKNNIRESLKYYFNKLIERDLLSKNIYIYIRASIKKGHAPLGLES